MHHFACRRTFNAKKYPRVLAGVSLFHPSSWGGFSGSRVSSATPFSFHQRRATDRTIRDEKRLRQRTRDQSMKDVGVEEGLVGSEGLEPPTSCL